MRVEVTRWWKNRPQGANILKVESMTGTGFKEKYPQYKHILPALTKGDKGKLFEETDNTIHSVCIVA